MKSESDQTEPSLLIRLCYTYSGNQIVKVRDGIAGPNNATSFHFIDNANKAVEYEYDENGNMTKDLNKNISSIQYNSLNLPTVVSFLGIPHHYIQYEYNSDGTKMKSKYVRALHIPIIGSPQLASPSTTIGGMTGDRLIPAAPVTADSIEYLGNFIFYNGTLEMALFDGGYLTIDTQGTSHCHYYQCDHLGSIRAVVDETGAMEYTNAYYPFGALHSQSATQDLQRYKFCGKELDRMHGLNLLDFGARWYDPLLGRFTTIDPMAEKYYATSPYAYCGNDPVNAVDPDGTEIYMVGSYKQRMELLGFLQQLSNDELTIKQNGQVFIKNTGNRNSGQNLIVGTELVASLLNHQHKVIIQNTLKNSRTHSVYRGNSTNGKGTDVNVFVNPKKPVNILVRNNETGNSVYEITPTYITLGHELVHSLHNIYGTAKDHEDKSEYIFKDIDGQMKKTKARTEELETTGIIGNAPFSENKLREEHNINLRIQY